MAENWNTEMSPAPATPMQEAPAHNTPGDHGINEGQREAVIRRKNDMIDQMVEQSEGKLNEETAAAAYKAFADSVIHFLGEGDKVQISGFGIFFNRVRAPRTSTIPATKERIQVPSKRVPVFKAGKNLKEASAFK